MMKRILLYHPEFLWGGAESVLINTIIALRDDYSLYIACRQKLTPDMIERINEFFSSDLVVTDVQQTFFIPNIIPNRSKLNRHITMRWCKLNTRKFDLFLSTSNFADFGVNGIQYLHFPPRRSGYGSTRQSFLNTSYSMVCNMISGFSEESRMKNLSLANSDWTRCELQKYYGLTNCEVLYPPVKIPNQGINSRMDNTFVMFSRISPEKRIKEGILLIQELRDITKKEISLIVIGNRSNKDFDYFNEISKMTRLLPWLHMKTEADLVEIQKLLEQTMFGLHMMPEEHFGITIAEMAAAGIIVFIPDRGGQKEIINDPGLMFESQNDAIQKIRSILEMDIAEKKHLSEQQRIKASFFSEVSYRQKILDVVNNAFKINVAEH